MGKMGLQARGTAGVDSASTGGTWDISNADRLGKSEIELVNIFIEGVAQIIRWEQALERGENIDKQINLWIANAQKPKVEKKNPIMAMVDKIKAKLPF
jgi:protein-arginine kinase